MGENSDIVSTALQIIEFLGTFTFAVSGIRQAAAKHVDWFGGFVCGFAVAIGGGTIRDMMLGVPPFWMLAPQYLICTVLAQLTVIAFAKHLKKLNNTWFVFDTLGLGLFTVAGIQKTLALNYPFWVVIVMGCITGVAGGMIRDVLLNNVPLIFKKEMYAMACIAGGCLYTLCYHLGMEDGLNSAICFLLICVMRFLAMRYHISLPVLHSDEESEEDS